MKILNLKTVKEKVGLSPTTIWRMEKKGKFPERINITGSRIGWSEEEIDQWLESRPRGICQREIGG